MPKSKNGPKAAQKNGEPKPSARNKRAEILTVATDYFGQQGYEDTKWADVAAAVGVGSTALYHYFESKLHCLYVIMAEAIEDFRQEFDQVTAEHDFAEGLEAVLRAGFDLTEHEVQRNRVLVAEQGLVGSRRDSPREEEARQVARARTHDLEVVWAPTWPVACSRAWSPSRIRSSSPAPSSASTTASSTGTGPGAS